MKFLILNSKKKKKKVVGSYNYALSTSPLPRPCQSFNRPHAPALCTHMLCILSLCFTLQGVLLTLPLLDGLGRPKRGVVGSVMASLSDDYTLLSVFTVPRTYNNFTFISKSSSFCLFKLRKFRSD